MGRTLSLLCLTIALAAPALPSTARAEDEVALSEAKARFAEGLALVDTGQHDAARLKFQQAWMIFRSPAVLYNLARAEQLTARDVEALEHFRLFLRIGASDPKVNEAMRDKAKENIRVLTDKVGMIEIDAPAAAQIFVDGRRLDERSQGPLPVRPGRHTVEATLDGRVKTATVECPAGSSAKAAFTFEPATLPATHGADASVAHGEDHGWSVARVTTVTLLAAGAVAGGVLFFVFRGKASDAVDSSRSVLNGGSCLGVQSYECDQAARLKDDRDTNTTLSVVSVAGAGVLAAGALAATLFWPKRDETKSAVAAPAVAPVVAPGYGGATLGGRF